MSCRIQTRRENDRTIVHLAGWLTDDEVPDLLVVCAESSELLIVELDELVSADSVGIDALMRIERQGARLVGLPEYLRLKLESLSRPRQR